MCWRYSPSQSPVSPALREFHTASICDSPFMTLDSCQSCGSYCLCLAPCRRHSLFTLGAELGHTTCPALCIFAPHCNSLSDQRNAPTVLFAKPYIQYETLFHLSILYEGGDFGPSTNGCCDNGRSLQMRRRPIVWQHRDDGIVRWRGWGRWIARRDTDILMLFCIGGLGFLGQLSLVDSLYLVKNLRRLSKPERGLKWDKIARCLASL